MKKEDAQWEWFALNLDLLDLHTTGLKVFGTLLVIGDDGAALGIVISVSLETLHLSRLHVVEILLAEMDADRACERVVRY